MNKLMLAMAVASVSLLTACGGEDNDRVIINGGGEQGSGTTPEAGDTRISTLAAAGATCGTVGTQSGLDVRTGTDTWLPLCDLNGRIAENATLTADSAYRLNGYIHVGSGDSEITDKAAVESAGVTLTVEPGVQFRSSGRGSLIITRGSKLEANGTASQPIVMSSLDFGFEGQGEWGGLVVHGFAGNNKCGTSLDVIGSGRTVADLPTICNTADEAGTGFHGGNEDADDSGSIQYLIVAEGGFEIAPDSEVNGITLHSVGYGTTIENVMVYNNADDGIEFFGGAANVKNLILVDNGDESLDWDDGYRGNVQFSLIRQGVSNTGDHGIEADNKGRATDATPRSNPSLSNITFQENSAQGADDLFRFKEGTAGRLEKVAADGYRECIRLEEADTGNVVIADSLLECGSADSGTTAVVELVAGENGTAGAVSVNGSTTLTVADLPTVALGNAYEVTGNAAATLSSATTTASANASTGFFMETNYIGAVDPTVTAPASAWWNWANAVVPAAFQ